jgi:hypothetical protein
MLPIPRSVIVATVSVAAGGALFGVAAGGMVGIDRDLQATAAPPARIQTVEFRGVVEPGDCPRHHGRSDDEGRV